MTDLNYSKLKVLVVDDFNSFRLALNKMLSELGFRHVDNAASATKALGFCKKQSYDLILCDYNLGSGKNGQQLLDELKQKKLLKKQDVFVLLSADTSRNVVMSASDYEPDAYLTKPITNKMIEQRLARLLNRRKEMLTILSLIQAAKKDEAIIKLKEKITQNSRYSMDCQKLLAELYLELSQFDEAEKIYRSVLAMRPLSWAQVGLSQVRLASGDAKTAAKWLQDIVKANPSYMKAYDALTKALTELSDFEGLQEHLLKAVEASPLSLGRQTQLADTALKNGDVDVAAKAYRKVVKHAEHSRHDKPENYVNYAKAVAQCFEKGGHQAEVYGKDILSLADKIQGKFEVEDNEDLKLQLISSQILSLKGEMSQANEILESVLPGIDENHLGDIDLEIELFKSYRANQRLADAKHLLDQLLLHYADDQEALEKIDKLLPEPISQNGKKILAKINKKGISAYQSGDFLQSIECFSKAEKKFPQYIGLKLNLAQALIGKMKTDTREEGDMKRCLAIFDMVKRHIHEDKSNHKRFLQLQEMLKLIPGS